MALLPPVGCASSRSCAASCGAIAPRSGSARAVGIFSGLAMAVLAAYPIFTAAGQLALPPTPTELPRRTGGSPVTQRGLGGAAAARFFAPADQLGQPARRWRAAAVGGGCLALVVCFADAGVSVSFSRVRAEPALVLDVSGRCTCCPSRSSGRGCG
jgi:hypothetical protein